MQQTVQLVVTKSCGRKTHKSYVIKLVDNTVVFERKGKEIILRLSDLIGCSQWKSKSPNDKGSYFTLVSYPMVYDKEDREKKLYRDRKIYVVRIESGSSYDDNYKVVERWVLEVGSRIKTLTAPHRLPLPPPDQRRLLIIVNPYSGPGKAMQIYEKQVQPVLEEANIIFKLVITERANHAKELVCKMDLKTFDGIVIVSGDGLPHEVLNGLMLREDREQAIECPLGIVPGGSGNGLAAAICHESEEPFEGTYFATECAVMIARPDYMPLRLVHVETESQHLAAFMGVSWGIVADIDIESEKFRKSLGHTRFVVFGVIRTFGLRSYKGKLSYLPYVDVDGLPVNDVSSTTSDKAQQTMVAHNTKRRINLKTANFSESHSSIEMRPVKRRSSSRRISSTHGEEDSPHHPFQVNNSINNNNITPEISDNSKKSTKSKHLEKAWRRRYIADQSQIPPLDQPLPDSWITLEDEFVSVNVAFISHLASDAVLMPDCELNEEALYLMIITKARATIPQVVRFLLGLENASHLTLPCLQIIPVKAVRLEPLTTGGNITVDGELVETKPIQMVSTSYRATVMGRQSTRL